MKKESIKKFVKEHKTEIIIGAVGIISSAALGIIGVKLSKRPMYDNLISASDEFMEFLKAYDKASEGCTQYLPLTLQEVAAAIDKDGIVRDFVRDPDGGLFEIKNLIAFGNKVEL